METMLDSGGAIIRTDRHNLSKRRKTVIMGSGGSAVDNNGFN